MQNLESWDREKKIEMEALSCNYLLVFAQSLHFVNVLNYQYKNKEAMTQSSKSEHEFQSPKQHS